MIEELRVSLFAQTRRHGIQRLAAADPQGDREGRRGSTPVPHHRGRRRPCRLGESWDGAGRCTLRPVRRKARPVQDPTELFQFESDTSPSQLQELQASVLVVALGGFIDAGHTQRLHGRPHPRDARARVVASFDVDQLLDYRGRRPAMVFDRDRWTQLRRPAPAAPPRRRPRRRALPAARRPRARLPVGAHGRGDRQLLIRTFGVDLTVSVHGIPMAVPHTRPLGVTAHAHQPAPHRPATTRRSARSRCRRASRRCSSCGSARPVTTPSASPSTCRTTSARPSSPTRPLLGLERVRAATGPRPRPARARGDGRAQPGRDRPADGGVRRDHARSCEALEQQYDTFIEGRQQPSLLATDLSDLPTADEIGAEFEAFLKDVTDGRRAAPAPRRIPLVGWRHPRSRLWSRDHARPTGRPGWSGLGLGPAADDRGVGDEPDLVGAGPPAGRARRACRSTRPPRPRRAARARGRAARRAGTARSGRPGRASRARTVAAHALKSSAAEPWMTALRANRPRAAVVARGRNSALPDGSGDPARAGRHAAEADEPAAPGAQRLAPRRRRHTRGRAGPWRRGRRARGP